MQPQRQKSLWVDTDLALGADAGDVDDGYALAWLLCQADVHVEGISVVSGNTDAATAARCVSALLEVAGRSEVPIHGPDTAAPALLGLSNATDVLAIGPLSNLGAALALNPAHRWRRVTVVGGLHRLWPRPWLALSDLNRRRDPASWQQVMCRQRVLQCPLDQARRVRANRSLLATLTDAPGLSAYLGHHTERWLHGAWARNGGPSIPLWDLTAAMLVMDRLPAARQVEHCLVDFDVTAAQRRFRDDLCGALLTETAPSGG